MGAYQRIACSRRSDSGARAKNKASERAGKKRGETSSFAGGPLSERLEQANQRMFTTIAQICILIDL